LQRRGLSFDEPPQYGASRHATLVPAINLDRTRVKVVDGLCGCDQFSLNLSLPCGPDDPNR
jgi:hypothetical protein